MGTILYFSFAVNLQINITQFTDKQSSISKVGEWKRDLVVRVKTEEGEGREERRCEERVERREGKCDGNTMQ